VSVYDPEAARQLMRVAGVGPLAFDLTFPNRTRSKELAQILQRQWRANLGAEVNLVMQESTVWGQNFLSLKYRGVLEAGMGADYLDPNCFLEMFSRRNESGWYDPEFNRLLNHANAEGNSAERMRKLAACEERLLRAAPVLPLFFDAYTYLQKPYVSGLRPNVLDLPEYKDVWIDTTWRPS
jgi:oligopeptide transport system substrate-binding protein